MTFVQKPSATLPSEKLTRSSESGTWDALLHPFSDRRNSANSSLPLHLRVAQETYANLDVELDPETKTYWCFMNPQGRPSYTPGLLRDILAVQRSVNAICAEQTPGETMPLHYFVMGSRIPGIYNLGGDLGLFAQKIRNGERANLTTYAHSCVDALWVDAPVTKIALVQGDALGGGFEAALACNVIVAERSAKFGLPEVLFNLFPGMGAYSFLSRRLDGQRAEKLILSGKVFTAEEMHEMGIVDVLAEDGDGQRAVQEYIDRHARRHNAYRAVMQVRQRVNPVTIEELRDVTDIWVDAAMRLTEADLRKMVRLTAAQDRRLAGATVGSDTTGPTRVAAE
jgi:DSF synthase